MNGAREMGARVEVDFDSSEVRQDGTPVNLAGKQLQLLRSLAEHRGKVVSREELLGNVWAYQAGVSSNPHTVRRVGYRFSPRAHPPLG